MRRGATLVSGNLCDGPDWQADEPHVAPIDPVQAATDTIAESRRISALVVDEIAAWSDILHYAA